MFTTVSARHCNRLITQGILAMRSEGMQPYDCLMHAIQSGVEYPDAVWLVTRVLKLDNDQVRMMEDDYLTFAS